MSATYRFPARGNRAAVKLVWYQGQMKPPAWREKRIPQWPDAHLFVGDQGMLLSNYSKYVLLPEKDFAGFVPPPKIIPDSLGHRQEWLHACKTGAPTTCHFGYSGPLTEANHLGNVAFPLGPEDPVGREDDAHPERAGRRALPEARVPAGLDAGVTVYHRAQRRASGRPGHRT